MSSGPAQFRGDSLFVWNGRGASPIASVTPQLYTGLTKKFKVPENSVVEFAVNYDEPAARIYSCMHSGTVSNKIFLKHDPYNVFPNPRWNYSLEHFPALQLQIKRSSGIYENVVYDVIYLNPITHQALLSVNAPDFTKIQWGVADMMEVRSLLSSTYKYATPVRTHFSSNTFMSVPFFRAIDPYRYLYLISYRSGGVAEDVLYPVSGISHGGFKLPGMDQPLGSDKLIAIMELDIKSNRYRNWYNGSGTPEWIESNPAWVSEMISTSISPSNEMVLTSRYSAIPEVTLTELVNSLVYFS
jgi:hypothetical protein